MHHVDIRNVSLGQMQYFVKVAEYRSITNAAKYFNLSQPTLSKKLKSLENQLDIQLFRRSSHTIFLTPAGRYLYESWNHRLQLIEQDIQHAHVLQTGRSKSLVAAYLDSFRPDSILLPVVQAFSTDYPNVHIRIESDAAQDIRRMLLQGEADLIFSVYYDFVSRDLENVEWKLLGRTPHCACMRKTNPLAQKETLAVSDLRQSDFICISPQYLPEYADMLHSLCVPYGFVPNIVRYVTSANALTLNLYTDHDIFICDQYYADLNEAEHCRVPIQETESGFVVAWRRDNRNPSLGQFLQEVLFQFGMEEQQ